MIRWQTNTDSTLTRIYSKKLKKKYYRHGESLVLLAPTPLWKQALIRQATTTAVALASANTTRLSSSSSLSLQRVWLVDKPVWIVTPFGSRFVHLIVPSLSLSLSHSNHSSLLPFYLHHINGKIILLVLYQFIVGSFIFILLSFT